MASRPLDDAAPQKRIAAALQHRFFLRAHMAAILTATVLVGLGVTRGLYLLHLNIFPVRYGMAVIAAYAAFIGLIKVWLSYIAFCARRASSRSGSSDDWFQCVNFGGGGSSSFSGSSSGPSFGSGGGKFGGGGASGSWGDSSDANVPMVAATSQSTFHGSSSSSKSSSGGGGGDDLGELMLVVLIIALVVAVIVSFPWIVYAAPAILSEVVFNATLAGALARHTRQATRGEWVGGVLKKTALPFALVLVMAIAVGWWAQHICPGATRLRDAVPCIQPAS